MLEILQAHFEDENAISQFWARVQRGSDDECWPWLKAKTTLGYGAFNIPGYKRVRAHRFAYSLANGVIPDGLCVCHSCDNRLCCNPSHLWLGTVADNNRDKMQKGRHRYGPRDFDKVNWARGSRVGRSRLTEEDIPIIRSRLAKGETLRAIAKDYGVDNTSISQLKLGRTWSHVP